MSFDRDLIVLGGGSGGLAAAKEAARLGAKTALFDYVAPSPQGTKWGLGGTCVNVGCIPKKLMHRSATIGRMLHKEAAAYGWKLADGDDDDDTKAPHHDWAALTQNIRGYIKSLNFTYRTGLRKAGVELILAEASFQDAHTVVYSDPKTGEPQTLTAKHIIVSVGGRPTLPEEAIVPGAKALSVTSDDLFYLPKPPGQTIVIGAAYIGLECAGFLTEMGMDVTVAARSVLLRSFDRQCAEKVGGLMAELGTKFKYGVTPARLDKAPETGRITVTWSDGSTQDCDTVLYAAGRSAATAPLHLDRAGVQYDADSGKIKVWANDQTTADSIWAIGDCADGRPELTPVAIKAGEKLARRLFGGSAELMDYEGVATVVFTPIEYGCCGLSEEAAELKHGKDDIETFLFEYSPIEVSVAHWQKHPSTHTDEMDVDFSLTNLSKLVCLKSQNLRIVGFHCVGLSAAEITQGYALALKTGATKAMFDDTIGIHPTEAESFHDMDVTRLSGLDWKAQGGCGGGKCG